MGHRRPNTYTHTYTHINTSRKLGYIKLREFNSRAKQKVQAAVAALETQGAHRSRGGRGGCFYSITWID